MPFENNYDSVQDIPEQKQQQDNPEFDNYKAKQQAQKMEELSSKMKEIRNLEAQDMDAPYASMENSSVGGGGSYSSIENSMDNGGEEIGYDSMENNGDKHMYSTENGEEISYDSMENAGDKYMYSTENGEEIGYDSIQNTDDLDKHMYSMDNGEETGYDSIQNASLDNVTSMKESTSTFKAEIPAEKFNKLNQNQKDYVKSVEDWVNESIKETDAKVKELDKQAEDLENKAKQAEKTGDKNTAADLKAEAQAVRVASDLGKNMGKDYAENEGKRMIAELMNESNNS